MVRIGYYTTPSNPNMIGYIGLYGGSFLIDYIDLNEKLEKLITWFLETTEGSLDIEYNDDNLSKLKRLQSELKKYNWIGTLRAYTDCDDFIDSDSIFLGYDIGADSMYYSPLGDGILLNYDPQKEFFFDMTIEEFVNFKKNINENWLFSSFDVAVEFTRYCNHINDKYLYCIESETNWRIFSIYAFP